MLEEIKNISQHNENTSNYILKSDVERLAEMVKEHLDRSKGKPGTVHIWRSSSK